MNWLHQWLRQRIGKSVFRDVDDELRFHIEQRTDEYARTGLSRRDAATKARRRFGNLRQVANTCYTVNSGYKHTEERKSYVHDLWQDIRLTIRTHARSPGFAIVAVTTLALGIGANTAVFSAVNSVLLTPLPYDEPQNLVRMFAAWDENPTAREVMSALDFLDYRDGVEGMEQLAGLYTYRERGVDLMTANGPVRLRALPVGAGYFETFRVTPLRGRTFERNEEREDAFVGILSHRAWRDYTESDPEIVGKSLTLDAQPYTVIGVMRPTFIDVVAGDDVDIWIPQDLQPGGYNSRGNMYLSVIGRLSAGATIAQAQAQVDAITDRLAQEFPATNDWKRAYVVPMYDDVVRNSNTMLVVLMGASALVLLIACVNVGNLALARGVARQNEIGIRLALGSKRERLVRQVFTESMVIAAIGGIAGLGVASVGFRALIATSPQSLARAEEVGFDVTLLVFAVGLTAFTGLIFGLAPALGLTNIGLHNSLRENARGATLGKGGARLRNTLAVGQVSLAVMLLVGAGILMRSFVNLQQVEAGFDPDGVTTFEVHLPDARFGEPEARIAFHQNFANRLRSIPGVRAAGATSWLPVNGAYHSWGLDVVGTPDEETGFGIQVRVIEGEYFDAMRIPLQQGRLFNATDIADHEHVAILNQSAAQRAFGEQSGLNARIRVGGQEWTVVGVVGDVAHTANGEFAPKVYLPHAQFGDNRNWALIQTIASTGDVDLIPSIRRQLAQIDPQLVVYRPGSMNEIAARHVSRQKFAFTLMGTFAGIALSLAAVGLYGVLSYSVSRRFHELGIRMALGARASQILHIVAREGVAVTATGIVAGLAAAFGLARFLQSLTFEISVTDPTIYAIVAVIIGIVSCAAVALPAWRAAHVDPVEAIRTE